VAVKAALAVQYVCLAAALGLAAYISVGRLFKRWMEARAEAELARLALFDQVMEAREEARPGELPLLPLKLEYVRRYQLDVQTRYYGGRGEQHRRAAGQSSRVTLLLQILSVLAFLPLFVVAGDFLGLITFDSLLPYFIFLAIGTGVSGVLGALAAFSAMNLDERNAARYLVVHENLKDLSGESLTQAREAAARGDETAVGLFAGAVQRLISSEHQEWIVLRNHIQRPEQMVAVALDPVRVGMPGAGGL
jgi:hypothetical protein